MNQIKDQITLPKEVLQDQIVAPKEEISSQAKEKKTTQKKVTVSKSKEKTSSRKKVVNKTKPDKINTKENNKQIEDKKEIKTTQVLANQIKKNPTLIAPPAVISKNKVNHKNNREENNSHKEERQPKFSTKVSYIQRLDISKLKELAQSIDIENFGRLTKSQLVSEIVKKKANSGEEVLIGEGVLEILPDGFGFLRSPTYDFLPSAEDIYISHQQIKRCNLKRGDNVLGIIKPPKEKEKYFALLMVEKVNGQNISLAKNRVHFENLTPMYPNERIIMETDSKNISGRLLDLTAPIGKGQRGLIVAPPRSGKTMIIQNIANSISKNNPEIKLIVLLIDERPEEVTEMERSIQGEVIASTFDEPAERHVQVANIVIEKAKRMVEYGNDVVILLDSITRLARAFNTVQPHSGKILSGGVDSNALHKPKRFFGAARNIEEGGSLTIIASALIETGSRMDEVIFEEFKGTGNMELVLDRKLSERRIYPAVDILKSGTRKEELLYHPDELEIIYSLRRGIAGLTPIDSMKILLDKMKKTDNNTTFLLSMKDSANV